MAEILLYRLGIRSDRDRVLEAAAKRATPFELKQPVTPAKIAAAIAQVSIALLNHDLSPLEANTMLFALQTMLTAVRMGILADTINQRSQPQPKQEELCTTQGSSRSQRSKASASGRNSGLRSGSPATTTSYSPKSRSASSAPRKSSQNELTAEKVALLDQGMAALADASTLTPTALSAALAISAKLLRPLGVTVSIIGNERTARFLLIEFAGGQFSRKAGEPAKAGRITTVADDPREELTAHSYPTSSYEPGAQEQMRRENEALATDTTPESTGARRTGRQ